MILEQPRSADVVASTNVRALTIEKTKFLNFIRGSELLEKFKRLNDIRRTGTWETLSHSRFLQGITSAQKTQLELIMEQRTYPAGTRILMKGEICYEAFIVKRGEVNVVVDGEVIETLGWGDFCGEIYQIQKEAPSSFDFIAVSEIEVYRISRENLVDYIQENPGVYMRLLRIYGK